jgi:hypothetical protein
MASTSAMSNGNRPAELLLEVLTSAAEPVFWALLLCPRAFLMPFHMLLPLPRRPIDTADRTNTIKASVRITRGLNSKP